MQNTINFLLAILYALIGLCMAIAGSNWKEFCGKSNGKFIFPNLANDWASRITWIERLCG